MAPQPTDDRLRVILAGGGSGGHLMPAAALARGLCQLLPGCRPVFLLTSGRLEQHCLPALEGFQTVWLPRLSPGDGSGWAGLPLRALGGSTRAMEAIRWVAPHVLVGLGGRQCALPLLLARGLAVRTALMESNAVPGRAVRILAPLADLVLVQWRRTAAHLACRRVATVGNPVRQKLFGVDRYRARRRLGLAPRRTTLLVMGGSQGALSLNEAVWDALAAIHAEMPALQILHLTGVEHLPRALARQERVPEDAYRPIGFLHRMEDAFAAADLVIARAGGSTLAELAALGLPSVLVPHPSPLIHQRENAAVLAEAGAAIAIDPADLTPESLTEAVVSLVQDEDRRHRMAQSALCRGRPGAALRAAAELARLAGFSLPVPPLLPESTTTQPVSRAA